MPFSSARLSAHSSSSVGSSSSKASSPLSPNGGSRRHSDANGPSPPPRNPARLQSQEPGTPLSPPSPEGSSDMLDSYGDPTLRVPSPRRPPPSAFRALARANGKEPAHGPVHLPQQRAGRAPWIIDSLEARRVQENWQGSERVILVLGEPTRQTLAPLLYSEHFESTLILVGSVRPIPDIEALNSPSHLMNSGDQRRIYPTVQPFTISSHAAKEGTTAIIAQGVAIADSYRRSGGAAGLAAAGKAPTSWKNGNRSRRGSNASLSETMTPPDTPTGGRKRFSSFGRKGSNGSASPVAAPSPSASTQDLPGRLSSSSSRAPSIINVERPERTHMRRISSILRGEDRPVAEGSPVDAVINFIPSLPYEQDPQRALQLMMQSALVLTTAILPVFTSAVTPNSYAAAIPQIQLAPLSLVHICPLNAPMQLAPVVERFLLPLLPSLSERVRRDLFACVTGLGAWVAPNADPYNDGLTGAETLLFGGVRCSAIGQPEGVQPQAMLPGWDHCVTSPGVIVEWAGRTESPPCFSRRASSHALSEVRSAHSHALATSPKKTASPLPSPISEHMHKFPTSGSLSTVPYPAPPPLPRKNSLTKPRSMLDMREPTRDAARTERVLAARRSDPDPQPQAKRYASQAPAIPSLPFGSSGSYNSRSRSPAPLPSGAATPIASAFTARAPSGLRNNVSHSFQTTSPPTPELDASSSSCSSASVLEPASTEERSTHSSRQESTRGKEQQSNFKRSGSISARYGFSLTSIFRRRGGVRA